MTALEGWKALVSSIDRNRAREAKFYKPVFLIAAIDLADEGILDALDLDAAALLQRFTDYVRPHYPNRADSGWQPLWFLTNDGIWSFFRGGKLLTQRSIGGRGQPSTPQVLLKQFDRMVINAPLRQLWNDADQRATLRDQLVLILADDGQISSNQFARFFFNNLFLKQVGREPTEEEYGAYLRELRKQQDLFDGKDFDEPIVASSASAIALPTLIRLLQSITTFNLSPSLWGRLSRAGYSRVGDLATASASALLSLPIVDEAELAELARHLSGLDLGFGMEIPGWPPEESADQGAAVITMRVRRLSQDPLGAQFVETGERLVIREASADRDYVAALNPMTQQLHHEALRKLRVFAERANRLDNQRGWEGVTGLCERFVRLMHRDTTDIPVVIGGVYSAALELGSFLEFDRELRRSPSEAPTPLESDVRRALEDAVRTMAPWVRRFPSAQEADDEGGQFLVRTLLVPSAEATLEHAQTSQLLNAGDVAALKGLFEAAGRGDTVGQKAGSRAVRSTRNIVVVAASVAEALLNAAGSADAATSSHLSSRLNAFLGSARSEVLELVRDLPGDIRLAVEALMSIAQTEPAFESGRSDQPDH